MIIIRKIVTFTSKITIKRVFQTIFSLNFKNIISLMQSSSKNNLIFILIFGLIVGVYAYVKFSGYSEKKKTQNTTTDDKEADTDILDIVPKEGFKKLNAYLNCLNRNRSRARESYNRYGTWLKDIRKGPNGDESYKYGLYTIYGGEYYCDKLAEVHDHSPQYAKIEAAADTYVAAMQNLHEILIRADRYYENEDWKDDNMQKGKEMHPYIMEAFDRYFESENALIAEIEEAGSKIPSELNPTVLSVVKKVEELEKLIRENGNTDAQKSIIEAVELAANQVENLPDYKDNYRSWNDQNYSLIKEAKKLMRENQEKKANKDARYNFYSEYARWVSYYNGLKPENTFLHKPEVTNIIPDNLLRNS